MCSFSAIFVGIVFIILLKEVTLYIMLLSKVDKSVGKTLLISMLMNLACIFVLLHIFKINCLIL